MTDEENIPAAQQEQKENPRLPGQNENRERKGRHKTKARKGEKATHRVMEQTLGKTERLHKRDFRFAQWAKSGRTSHFLLFKNNKGQSIARFGVVVSRKIKGAVRRNRIKRLLREFFRLNKQLFGDCDFSVRVTRMPPRVTFDAVSRELSVLVTRAANR
jgi:ribonuclease P protein component